MSRRLSIVLVVAAFAGGCPKTTPVAPDPEPIVDPDPEPDPEDEPDEVEPPRPQSAVDGDAKVPDRWRPRFREWAAEDMGGIYTRVLDAAEVSTNGATVVLLRHFEFDDQCREGPTTLQIVEQDGETNYTTDHWGDNCCPGVPCVIDSPIQWNLRYINAIAAKDRAALAKLVAAKGVSWQITALDGKKTRKLTPKDVLAGKLDDGPTCPFMSARSECTTIASGDKTESFQCTCVAPGSSATFAWTKEGAGWVLMRIDESSH